MRYNDLITDAGYASLAFRRGSGWYTPDTPLLPGTTRTRLLREGTIRAARITADEIGRYSELSIFNAMLPLGTICLPVSALHHDWSYSYD